MFDLLQIFLNCFYIFENLVFLNLVHVNITLKFEYLVIF